MFFAGQDIFLTYKEINQSIP